MIFKEFGNKSKPVIVFIHGGGVSWWSWKKQIEALQEDYFIAAAVIDGHGEAWETGFHSIGESAERAIGYIKDNFNGKVYALCGLSLGAQIIVEMLSRQYSISEYAVIESALVYPIRFASALTVPMFSLSYGLIKKRWFAKQQAKSLCVPEELFEDYYRDSCLMTKESLVNMTISNGNYAVPPTLCNTKAKTLILIGERELGIMKKSALLLHNTIKGSVLKIAEKAGHGETSLINSDKYLDLLKSLISADYSNK